LIFGGGARVAPCRETFRETLEQQPVAIHLPQIFDLPAASDLQKAAEVDFHFTIP
jgi:hypothetical protein